MTGLRSSPHMLPQRSTGRVMGEVGLCLLPGILALATVFGWAVLVTVSACAAMAVACEALALRLRGLPVRRGLADNSALVSGLLLGVALPPLLPLWITLIAVAAAILLAKHLYGGLGQNPFNPAMVGYVVVLVAFPLQMSTWVAPAELANARPGPLQAVTAILLGAPQETLDAWTRATPLDVFKFRDGLTVAEAFAQPDFAAFAGTGWQSVNLAFLLGGAILLWRRLSTWHAPAGMLATLALLAAVFNGTGGSAAAGPPLFHLFSGATMLGAFFIVTDPVSGATSNRGRLLFGIGVGVLVFVIRVWGNYPDAVAFAVLLMNMAAPALDQLTRPRVYGHGQPRPRRPAGP